jgi:hypothetical protein
VNGLGPATSSPGNAFKRPETIPTNGLKSSQPTRNPVRENRR